MRVRKRCLGVGVFVILQIRLGKADEMWGSVVTPRRWDRCLGVGDCVGGLVGQRGGAFGDMDGAWLGRGDEVGWGWDRRLGIE
ncbi:hypothetical protein PIB30_092150, partial [Stylosanthes scabra]|nr:hypothetical protein [Stylosanthes scabra]